MVNLIRRLLCDSRFPHVCQRDDEILLGRHSRPALAPRVSWNPDQVQTKQRHWRLLLEIYLLVSYLLVVAIWWVAWPARHHLGISKTYRHAKFYSVTALGASTLRRRFPHCRCCRCGRTLRAPVHPAARTSGLLLLVIWPSVHCAQGIFFFFRLHTHLQILIIVGVVPILQLLQ